MKTKEDTGEETREETRILLKSRLTLNQLYSYIEYKYGNCTLIDNTHNDHFVLSFLDQEQEKTLNCFFLNFTEQDQYNSVLLTLICNRKSVHTLVDICEGLNKYLLFNNNLLFIIKKMFRC